MTSHPTAIIQARAGSTRLQGKVLAGIQDRTVLEYVIRRCRLSKKLNNVVLATTVLPIDDPVAGLAGSLGVDVFRGSESDVLDRYVKAAEWCGADVIVRITADCPLIDPAIIDQTVDMYMEKPADYVFFNGYPNGLGAAEVLTLTALRQARAETSPEDVYYREHVMTYLTDNPDKFSLEIYQAPAEFFRPELRLSVDESDDLELVRRVCNAFYPRFNFSTREIIDFFDRNSELAVLNAHVIQKT